MAAAPLRRVMARSPLWVSVTCKPVVRRVNRVAAWSNRRRSRRKIGSLSQKPAAQREIGALLDERVGEAGNIRHPVLPVGIEGDDEVGCLRDGIFNPGLQRGALPEIERMHDDDRPCRARMVGGVILKAVIDHDDRVARSSHISHHAGNDRPFVIGGDHHTDLMPRDEFHLTRTFAGWLPI
jgi:hypothetical protein